MASSIDRLREKAAQVRQAAMWKGTGRVTGPTESTPLATTKGTGETRSRDLWHFQMYKGASLTGKFVGFESSSKALKLCFYAMLTYFVVAYVAFSVIFEPQWTFVDSLYFSVVTFTTVGYGDLAPTSEGGRLFAIFYVLFGIVILGVALGIIGDRVIQAQEMAIDSVKRSAESRVMSMFSDDAEESEKAASVRASVLEDAQDERPLWKDCCLIMFKDGPIVFIILLLSMVIGKNEGWSYITTFYYAIITTTTVGYGDLAPETQSMRLFAVFFIPISVAVFANVLGRIAGFYMDRQAALHEKQFLQRELTLADLAVMDVDGDGGVSLGEFLSFMLVAMQKVDKESIDDLIKLFHRLDADGSGSLQKNDLILLTQRKSFRRTEVA